MADYRNIQREAVNDEFTTVFKEAAQFISKEEHVNVIGEGYKDILSDQRVFGKYVDKLVEGFDATTEEQLRGLFENNRMHVIMENALSGIPPIASLAMPAIARVWAKFGLKNAIPTEVVSKPAFSIAFNKPYIVNNETKEKYYLPDSLRDPKNSLGGGKKLSTEEQVLPLKDLDLLSQVGCSHLGGDTIDKKLFINTITVEAKDATGANAETKVLRVASRLDLNRRLYEEVTVKHTDGTVTTDTIIGSVDLEKGTVKLMSMDGHVKSVTFNGFVSSESHNRSTEISFEIAKRDFEIGTGEHFETSMPLEFLTDTMAMYNIDGAAVATETISNVVSTKLEQQIFELLDNSQYLNPTYSTEFDVFPSANYAINPRDWLEEIKRVIDFQANKMKNDSYFYQGYFTIIGNPVDTAIIPNVSWSFNSSADNVNGIDVNYSIGAMSGTNRYVIISSDLVPAGDLIMVLIPTVPNYLTYKYFPYTFNVVNNYLNAQGKKYPNIMMTKRHIMEEFMPLISRIKIKNNNGRIGYQA